MVEPEIDIRSVGPGEFHVDLREAGSSTTHRVNVKSSYRDSLGIAEGQERKLVEESFRFLLEREPKESILGSFELSVIERYFPEYPDEIRRRV